MVKKMLEATSAQPNEKKTQEPEKPEKEDEPPKNRGKLIIDATCGKRDISYPTDLELLNKREKADRTNYRLSL